MPTYRTIPPLTEQQQQNFQKYIDRTPGQGPQGTCHIWKGGKQRRGYGAFNMKPQVFPAHRVAFFLKHGTIDPMLEVCHSCDFGHGGCVNDEHLWQGTRAENHRDMRSKGREARGDRHGTKTHPESIIRGEQCSYAKLTEELVLKIRELHAAGMTPLEISRLREIPVSRPTIYKIIKRERWAHIP